MLNQMGLGLLLTAKDMASGVIEKVRGEFEKLGEGSEAAGGRFKAGLAEFGQGAALLGAGVAVLGGAWKLAEAAAPFEASMSTVGYRTSATTAEMERLRQAAIDASAGLKIVSETDAARAMAVFAEGGNSAADTMTTLTPILKFAKANLMDVGMGAQFADNMMDLYGVKAEEVSEKLDKAQWVMRRFGMNVGDLSQLFGPLAQQAKTTGQSFDDMLLVFGAAAEVAGPRGAFRALQGAMMNLSDPDFGKKMKANFEGVEFKGPGDTLRPLTELLPDIAAKMDTMTEAQRANALQEVFGGKAAGGLAAILDKMREGVQTASGAVYHGADALKALNGEMLNSAGEVDRALNAMSPYDRAMQEAKASWDNMKRSLGEAFLPAFTTAMNWLSDKLEGIAKGWRELSPSTREFLGTLAVVLGYVLVGVGAFKMIAGAIGMARSAMLLFNVAAAANPITLVILAIAALVLWCYYVYKHWEDFYNFYVETGEAIAAKWHEFTDQMGRGWDRVVGWIEDRLSDLKRVVNWHIDFFLSLPGRAATMVKEAGLKILEFFTVTIPNEIRSAMEDAVAAVKEKLEEVPIIGKILSASGEEGGVYGAMTREAAPILTGPAAPTVPSAAPAATSLAARIAASPAPSRERTPARMPPININVPLHIEGEKVFEAFARVGRDLAAREYGEVPEEAG